MDNGNERSELVMQIIKYKNFLTIIEDEIFRKSAQEKIADLEKKLREIDE